MSKLVITNTGPDPVHVVDGTGAHTDLGVGSHGTFFAPVMAGPVGGVHEEAAPAPAPVIPPSAAVVATIDGAPVSPDITAAAVVQPAATAEIVSGGGGDFAGAGAGGSFDSGSSDSGSGSTD
jgi:hypothetical protein